MSKHNETGLNGERLAEKYLLQKGYTVLHRNWRSGKKEVDIIAQLNDVLIFVEVKTRSRMDFGFPEESVDYQKIDFLKTAATAFLDANPQFLKMQFDIISIEMKGSEVQEIVHFEDAFF